MNESTDACRILFEPPSEVWRKPRGRPRNSWVRTVTNDLANSYTGLPEAREAWSTGGCLRSIAQRTRIVVHADIGLDGLWRYDTILRRFINALLLFLLLLGGTITVMEWTSRRQSSTVKGWTGGLMLGSRWMSRVVCHVAAISLYLMFSRLMLGTSSALNLPTLTEAPLHSLYSVMFLCVP